jgi:ATP-binding cassette subfamily B protein
LLLLNQEISKNEGPPRKLSFEKKIELINVSYKHEDSSEYVLKDINLTIEKGDRIGIIGESGSGKSTLLDLIMGLVEPTGGLILVDGKPININLKGWYDNIAHVPQLIYLLDSSIERNITFGRSASDFDLEKLRAICEKVQIIDFIDSLPRGFKTIIGERGSRLSGGQRQRIGIARALYKNAKLIVLDEATSALDVKTESELINQIYKLDRDITMIFVAHRLSTLEKCDFIIELDKGTVSIRGRLSEIISSCK